MSRHRGPHLIVPRIPQRRFVALEPGTGAVLGWVALTAVSARPVYSGVAEESVYVDPEVHRAGVGSALLGAAIASSAARGIWTLQAGMRPGGSVEASLRLVGLASITWELSRCSAATVTAEGGSGVNLDLLALLIVAVLALMSFAYVAALTRL